MKHLNLEIPEYSKHFDPTKNQLPISIIEWDILKAQVSTYRKLFEARQKDFRERKKLEPKVKKVNGAKKKGKVKAEVAKKENTNGDLVNFGTKRKGRVKIEVVKKEEESVDFVDLTLEEMPKRQIINKKPKLEKVENNIVRRIGNTIIKRVQKTDTQCVDLTVDSDDESLSEVKF